MALALSTLAGCRGPHPKQLDPRVDQRARAPAGASDNKSNVRAGLGANLATLALMRERGNEMEDVAIRLAGMLNERLPDFFGPAMWIVSCGQELITPESSKCISA